MESSQGGQGVDPPFNPEQVVNALGMLQNNPKFYDKANKWLMKFQESDVSFPISLTLLEHPDDTVKVFASSTLKQCLLAKGHTLNSKDRKQYQGVMAGVLAKNWKSNKIVLTNLSICLVILLIQGVQESPHLLSDLLQWGQQNPTHRLPMLRVLKELPTEVFSSHVVSKDQYAALQSALHSQANLLVQVVAAFLNEKSAPDLCIEALEVAKNWSLNGLLPGQLIAGKLLLPILNFLVPYQQQQNQLNPSIVIPLVVEVAAICLILPDMKQMYPCVLAIFEWIGNRLASWIVPLCTGIPADVQSEKDAYGGGGDRTKTNLLKKLLTVLGECTTEFLEEIALGVASSDPQKPDVKLQASYVNLINTLVFALGDSRHQISMKAIDPLYVLFFRISAQMEMSRNCWVWQVQDGAWFMDVLRAVFRHLINNNTFYFDTHDLTFLYSEKAASSSYREDFQDYRLRNKTAELLVVVHEMLSQLDMAQKRNYLWTVSYTCSEIERVATMLQRGDKKEKNYAMRRLEACVWAFSELHEDMLLRTRGTVQVLATLRLLCQIPYNAVLTATSANFIMNFKDVLDAGNLDDVKAVIHFVLNQCISGGETDLTVKNHDYRLVLTRTLREIAECKSSKVMEVLRSQGIVPMAKYADQRLKPPKMQQGDTKVDPDHYGLKFDTDSECEHATLPLRLRARLAQGFVQLAVEQPSSAGPGGLVKGGEALVRWVVYPVLAQLEKWISSNNRALLAGISGELYILQMALRPVANLCSLMSIGGECKGPPVTFTEFPGVPQTNKPLVPELCQAVVFMARNIVKRHMTSPNIVRHLLRLFERVTALCLKDIQNIPVFGKKMLSDVVELTNLLYGNTSAGQDVGYSLLMRISGALLGIPYHELSKNKKNKKKGKDPSQVQRLPVNDQAERMQFVYQIASNMCLIGELVGQALPKVKPFQKNVSMGNVAVARLRYYMELMLHLATYCPEVVYNGLQGKPPLLERCFAVLYIVLLSADKKVLIKASLALLAKFAGENSPQFGPAVAQMLSHKLHHLLPSMFFIMLNVMNGDIDDSESKGTLLAQMASIMQALTHNFHQHFAKAIDTVVLALLQGGNQNSAQKWIQRFVQSKTEQDFKTTIVEFVGSHFSPTKK